MIIDATIVVITFVMRSIVVLLDYVRTWQKLFSVGLPVIGVLFRFGEEHGDTSSAANLRSPFILC
jgi:drug/metabolite transporter (DMT)-like permease